MSLTVSITGDGVTERRICVYADMLVRSFLNSSVPVIITSSLEAVGADSPGCEEMQI